MIDRYSREEMKKIWELDSKFKYYLNVELAVCKAYNQMGQIPNEALNDIVSKACFSVDFIIMFIMFSISRKEIAVITFDTVGRC